MSVWQWLLVGWAWLIAGCIWISAFRHLGLRFQERRGPSVQRAFPKDANQGLVHSRVDEPAMGRGPALAGPSRAS